MLLSSPSAASLQVWALTGVVISCIFARHGVAAAAIYWALTSVALTADTSLQSLQLLNLAVVVYDLSSDLQRVYHLARDPRRHRRRRAV